MEEQQRTEELLQGQLELWHHALGYIKSMALKCAMDAGIPDAIARCGGGATLPELLAATGLPPCNLSYLRRLMRVLTVSGIFHHQRKQPASGEHEEEAVYALTRASSLLVRGEGNGGAPSFGQLPFISILLGRTFVTPFFGMHPWIADERAAATSFFEREHGQALWEMARTSTGINDEFNQGMTADTRLIMHAVLTLSPAVFEGLTSLVDVGGADGTAAAAVARAFPHINCTVLDLPHVIENAPAPDEAAGGNTVRFVAGDMFHHIPSAHAVLLKIVINKIM
ncbi:hypothetical protein BRADI_1g47017v3 [Brachypodium distachyon]|uniref:O-methyltransferase domain-containing protein n=1 Tax=Brachypodium distachyon TaxID=15368 RepID=A0A2K2DPX6_BRADI|nr:hypothetical protein BRADI_1g47017v3 [Brachypodium distachyon]